MTYFRVEVSHGTVWVLAAVVIKHLLEVVHVVLGRDDYEKDLTKSNIAYCMATFLKTISFLVRVPVLSVSRY